VQRIQLRLATRLLLSYLVLVLVLLGVGAAGLMSTHRVAALGDDMYVNWTVAIEDLARANSAAQSSARITWALMNARNDEERRTFAAGVEQKNSTFTEAMTQFRATVQLDRERELVASIDKAWAAWLEAQRQARELSRDGTNVRGAVSFYMDHARPRVNELDGLLLTLTDVENTQAKALNTRAN
jgi:methyl-accepting chemotaxis protein